MVEINETVRMTLAALERNNFEAKSVENREEATKLILSLIPQDAVIGIGDSVTIKQISVLDELSKRGNRVINPFTDEFTIDKPQLRAQTQREALMTDVFITSANAITLNGKIVNVDMVGNRVAGTIFGPKRTIIVVGRNKIVNSVEEALYRIKNIIAPYHAQRKRFKTPCATTGVCSDCSSPQRICNITVILDKKPRRIESTVVVVNEDLGLSWNETWPRERVNEIKTNYHEYTGLFRG
ncbi:lactate utilization protein [Candidatus Bathyarchaeota archaeon]|nr:lactate utilization protein [Candidatus Bathyarchaeota archaeon]